jgi:hypothetical protein
VGADPGFVERADVIREFRLFEQGRAAVLGLVGPPGSGRTTELAALAARRLRGPEPAPTLWLRGADLRADDTSVADAAKRALERAGRIVAASRENPGASGRAAERSADAGVLPPRGYGGELGDIGPNRLARAASAAGRPLLLLLDGPEEMPPGLAHRLPAWTEATAAWLGETGARLVVGCRAEHWEGAGAGFPVELLHRPAVPSGAYPGGLSAPDAEGPLPACVRLGDLTEAEARLVRAGAGIPESALAPADARHPLVLRLFHEVRAALPETPAAHLGGEDGFAGPLDRDDVFAAHLDLMCLRVAVRLAAANGLRGTAVRRLAARVSGRVHEAARRCLGPGQGQLDRASFETVFPWGPAPGRGPAGITGWASAVLTEGLLVPAGDGYRFAHEELADWIQGGHLDLDTALRSLVHRWRAVPATVSGRTANTASSRRHARRSRSTATDPGADTLPVPRHRLGPVAETLLLLARQQGAAELTLRLEELVHAVDDLLPDVPDVPDALGDRLGDPLWWAGRLCSTVLLRVPDATPYTGVLRLLTERIVVWRERGRTVPAEFGPAFWAALPVPDTERFDLLRRLVVADPCRARAAEPSHPGETLAAPRYLDTVSRLLVAEPVAVYRHLTRWFDDERSLPATPHATVATAAQALLYAHRRRGLDELAEALVACAHRRGDELLAVLAEEEPSAVCRAVDRWARDEQPARRVAAVAYGLRAAPFAGTRADRELLRHAAFALLARPADGTLHGGALGILVRDPLTRARCLPQALERFAAGDPRLPPSALAAALTTHPEPVLGAFRDRLRRPGPDTAELLRTLADATTVALARRVAATVREAVELCPGAAAPLVAHLDRRLDHGTPTDTVLFRLVSGLLEGCARPVRVALAEILAAPGGEASAPLRRELLDLLLAHERDPVVLGTVLKAAAEGFGRRGAEATRELVHRVGLLLVRTPAGATGLDRGLVDLARHVPGFAPLAARWLTGSPEEWSGVVGPSTRRMIENLAGAGVLA